MEETLKPCPFCGCGPKLLDNSGERFFRYKGESKPGKTFLREEMHFRGSRQEKVNYKVFLVDDWQVVCSESGCCARNLNKHYRSKREAIEAWNTRHDER